MKVSVVHRAFEDQSKLVAFIDVDDNMSTNEALNYAFFRTQNLQGSWSRPGNPDWSEDVTVMAELPVSKKTGKEMGLRSTSIGDRIIVGNSCFKVDFEGFTLEA
jgi:hypothetical protein